MIAPVPSIPVFQTVHGLTYRVHPVAAPEKASKRAEPDSDQDSSQDQLTLENGDDPPRSSPQASD